MKKKVWIAIFVLGTCIYVALEVLMTNPIFGYAGAVVLAALGFKTASEVVAIREARKSMLEEQAHQQLLEKAKSKENAECWDTIEKIVLLDAKFRQNQFLRQYWDRLKNQFENFEDKERGLNRIISLNDGNSRTFISKTSNDARSKLENSLKRFTKRILAFSLTANGEAVENSVPDLEVILDSNDKLIELYNGLILEVARMNDKFDQDDPGIQSLIENLQALRREDEDDIDSM